ncbi:methylmalonate semialdehyde dehydrogenase [acylating] 2 [Arthrobacter sp. Hiyo6]|nr:methylmalonate semialdehyde dehydrogenase [acylating] 2 [Arthrobacter sp. Hiyo6]
MVRELSHYVDGQRVEGTSGRFSDVYDPCTGQVQARLPLASAEEVRNVVASAEKAQVEWGAMNPQRRGRILLKFVDLVNENLDELAALLSSEHGKTFRTPRGTSSAASKWWSSQPAPRTCSRVSSRTMPERASTCIHCASHWAWLPESRPLISRP